MIVTLTKYYREFGRRAQISSAEGYTLALDGAWLTVERDGKRWRLPFTAISVIEDDAPPRKK